MNGLLLLLAVLLGAATAALAVVPPSSSLSRRRLRVDRLTHHRSTRRRRRHIIVALVTCGTAVGVGWVLNGPRGAVIAGALLIAAGTVVRVAGAHVQDRRARQAGAAVARACGVLASYVRVGQVPSDALILVAQDCPVLAEAAAVQQIGGDVPGVLRSLAGRPGQGGLGDLARAWQVSSSTGAPMAPALEEVAAGLASDESLRSVVSAELAAPRSTGKLMAVLPVLGIALGYLLGGRPLAWLVDGAVGWSCLLAGLLMAAAGVLWIERLAHDATAGA